MSDPVLGALLAFGSALCFSFSNVFISKGASSKGDRGVLFSILMTLVFSLLLWLLVERGEIPVESPQGMWLGVFWFALAGIFAMVMGRTFIYASLRHLGVTRASALKKATPFFSVLFAWWLLGERVNGFDLVGMLLIAGAFAMITARSFEKLGREKAADVPALVDYSWGIGASVSYALSFVARKFGLFYMASPALGTLISAAVGFLYFVLGSLFSVRYRANLRNIFSNLNRWIFLAAVFISLGQIAVFAALSYTDVATVAIVSSLEVFVSAFLSVVIFRTEKSPGWLVYLGATTAVLGAMFVGYSPAI